MFLFVIQCQTVDSWWTKCLIHLLSILSCTGTHLWSNRLYVADR